MHLFQLIQKPVYQGLVFILLTLVLAFIVKPKSSDNAWVLCGLIYCLFIVTNAVFALFAVEAWHYFFVSLGISLLYLLAVAVMIKILMHVLKLEGSEESAMFFMVIIFHPVLLLLSMAAKWLFL